MQNEIKILDIKDVELVWKKAKIIEAKFMNHQQTPFFQSKKSSSKYIPSHQRISLSNERNDKNPCFRCNAPNWT